MHIKKDNKKNGLFLLNVVLIAVLLLIIAAGAVRAHYEATVTKTQYMQYESSESQVYFLSSERDEDGEFITDEDGNIERPGAWEALVDEDGEIVPNVYVLDFLLGNGRNEETYCTQNQNVSLLLFSTVGIADTEKIEVVLTDGRSDYMAIPSQVKERSALYNTYGPGWIYRFYNEAGEELTWTLTGKVFAYREMTLTVTGESENAAALTLMVSTRPGEL